MNSSVPTTVPCVTLGAPCPRRRLSVTGLVGATSVGPIVSARDDRVGRRPDDGTCDAEVHDDGAAVGGQHDVGRLQVAMDDAGLMGGHQTGSDFARNRDGDRQRDGQRAQGRAPRSSPAMNGIVRVLDAVDLAEIVNADDVAMRDLAREQQFALEPRLDVGGGRRIGHGVRPDDFQRDGDLSSLSQAWYTAPMPRPMPSNWMMRYRGPNVFPAESGLVPAPVCPASVHAGIRPTRARLIGQVIAMVGRHHRDRCCTLRGSGAAGQQAGLARASYARIPAGRP